VTSDPEFKVTTFCVVKYQKNLKVKVTIAQGWAQGSFVEAEARQGSNVFNRGKAEAESSRPRRGRLNSRQGRGEATP